MNWKRMGKGILFPPSALIWTIWPVAFGMLIYSSLVLEPTDVVSILSYVLSFYALMTIVLRIPAIIRFIRRFKRENRYVVRYTSDLRLRMYLSLAGAFVFNAFYSFFQLGLGILHRSVWFYAMSGYYLLLAVMRLLLARYTGSHLPDEQQDVEWRKYRICGICLLLMTLTLTIFIIYFIWKIRVFQHHEITTIAMAAFTFTSLTMAIVRVIRDKRQQSPVYSAAKAISLASAMVSLLTLENAMFTAFGQDSGELFRRIMLGATGAAVVFGVQAIAIHMIVRAGRNLRA